LRKLPRQADGSKPRFRGDQLLAVLRWRPASRRAVRSDLVVPLRPFSGDLADLAQRVEQAGAHDFLATGPAEALDAGVLVGLARLDEADLDVLIAAPVGQSSTGLLRAVVTPNRFRPAMQVDHPAYEGNNARSRHTRRRVAPPARDRLRRSHSGSGTPCRCTACRA
jgi:hypothetical protein